MADEKIDLLELGKIVAKIAKYEVEEAEKDKLSEAIYIVEMKDPRTFNPVWVELARFKDNMFRAISYAKDHSFTNYEHLYRVIQKKNNIEETVWHS